MVIMRNYSTMIWIIRLSTMISYCIRYGLPLSYQYNKIIILVIIIWPLHGGHPYLISDIGYQYITIQSWMTNWMNPPFLAQSRFPGHSRFPGPIGFGATAPWSSPPSMRRPTTGFLEAFHFQTKPCAYG
jgi:hypothetical protein